MSSNRSVGEAAKVRLDGQIRAARAAARDHAPTLQAYDRLLAVVRRRTSLLSLRTSLRGFDANVALVAIARFQQEWLVPPESWGAASACGWHAVRSLAEHLFARYSMPRCMTGVWLEGELGEQLPQHAWYVRLGRGENIRRIGVPMPITRAMAHRFASAPAHLGAIAALRWAQLSVLDASAELTQAILDTPLGRVLHGEDFWESVVRFFINHPELPLVHVGPIVDYLREQKLGRAEGLRPDGTYGSLPPTQPELTMRGRTPAALLRLVREWHGEIRRRKHASVSWSAAPFDGFLWIERVRRQGDEMLEARAWTITEIRTSAELDAEGRAMRHCVATYVPLCQSGKRSIWSMQVETPRGKRRAVTIEVDRNTRYILQARGKFNAMPRAEERSVMSRWAAREGLVVSESLRE